jgi:hypothetical protein
MFKAFVEEARYNRRRFTWELVGGDLGLWLDERVAIDDCGV